MNFNWKEFETIEELEADTEFASLSDIQKATIIDSFWITTINEVSEDSKEIAKQNILKEFENSLKPLLADYTTIDTLSFDMQLRESQKVIAGWTSDVLSAMVKTGETVLQLANKIIANNTYYSLAYAQANKIKRERLEELYK